MIIPVSAFAGVTHNKLRSTPASQTRRFMAVAFLSAAAFLLSRLPVLPHLFPKYLARLALENHACAWISPPNSFTPVGINLLPSGAYRMVASADFRLNARSFSGLTRDATLPRRQIVRGGSCAGQSGSSLLVRSKIGGKNRRKSLQNGLG